MCLSQVRTLNWVWRFFAVMCFSLVFCLSLQAQQGVLSTIRGTATDPSGAAVPNVAITVVNVNTGVSRSGTTNSAGDYEMPDLLLGTYRLTATAGGFSTFVADNIILTSTEVRRVDIVLQVGTAQTSVTVKANAAVIETETGQINSSASGKLIYESPTAWAGSEGYPAHIEITMPGVITPAGASRGN